MFIPLPFGPTQCYISLVLPSDAAFSTSLTTYQPSPWICVLLHPGHSFLEFACNGHSSHSTYFLRASVMLIMALEFDSTVDIAQSSPRHRYPLVDLYRAAATSSLGEIEYCYLFRWCYLGGASLHVEPSSNYALTKECPPNSFATMKRLKKRVLSSSERLKTEIIISNISPLAE